MGQIIVNHYNTVDSAIIDDIRNSLGQEAADEIREPIAYFAVVEWLLLTAVFIHFTRPYFKTFQEEAAKHHYGVLRKTAAKCWNYFFGKTPTYKYTRVDMKGEEIPSRFSLSFSIMADTNTEYKAKLLLEKTMSQPEMEAASAAFLAAMAAHHSHPSSGIVTDLTAQGVPAGAMFLLRYDVPSATLRPVSAIPWHDDYPG